jgi:hypothetical protein
MFNGCTLSLATDYKNKIFIQWQYSIPSSVFMWYTIKHRKWPIGIVKCRQCQNVMYSEGSVV